MMLLSVHDVAGELRRLLPGAGDVKIHKLLYYCQGWHLVWTGEPLFSEKVEAWANGPVVAVLWKAEKYGRDLPPPQPIDSETLATIKYVAARYGRFTGQELIALTHAEDPWIEASRRAGEQWDNSEITHHALVKFFSEQSDEAASRELAAWALADPETAARLRSMYEEMESREPVPDDFTSLSSLARDTTR